VYLPLNQTTRIKWQLISAALPRATWGARNFIRF